MALMVAHHDNTQLSSIHEHRRYILDLVDTSVGIVQMEIVMTL